MWLIINKPFADKRGHYSPDKTKEIEAQKQKMLKDDVVWLSNDPYLSEIVKIAKKERRKWKFYRIEILPCLSMNKYTYNKR